MSEYFRQAEPNQIVVDYPIGKEFWPKFVELNREQVRDLQELRFLPVSYTHLTLPTNREV